LAFSSFILIQIEQLKDQIARYYYSKSNENKRNAKKRIHLRQFWHRPNARKKRVQKGERKGRAR
jgi:hypothetical protein